MFVEWSVVVRGEGSMGYGGGRGCGWGEWTLGEKDRHTSHRMAALPKGQDTGALRSMPYYIFPFPFAERFIFFEEFQ